MATSTTTFGKVTTTVYREFVFGGHFQSLGAAAIAYISGTFLGISVSLDCLLAVYLIFYPLYLYNRYKEIDKDEISNPDRTQHFRQYVTIMPLILWFVIISVLVIVFIYSNFFALGFSLLLLVFGILYTTIFKKMTRSIAIFKDLYVSLFFALLVIYPIVYYGDTPDSKSVFLKIVLLFVFVYVKALAMQFILDIKDIQSDKADGLLTIPILLGKETSIQYISIFDVSISLIYPLLFSMVIPVFSSVIWVFILTIPFNLYCLNLIKKNNYLGYILASGEFVLWFFLVIAGRFIFNV